MKTKRTFSHLFCTALCCPALSAVVAFLLFAQVQTAALTRSWDNVAIGGGGYITGMAIHPTDPEILYARTDVGGAYRWDADQQELIPLLDWVSYENSNLYGVNGIALDVTDPNVVYLSLGKYVTRGPSDVYPSGWNPGSEFRRADSHGHCSGQGGAHMACAAK